MSSPTGIPSSKNIYTEIELHNYGQQENTNMGKRLHISRCKCEQRYGNKITHNGHTEIELNTTYRIVHLGH